MVKFTLPEKNNTILASQYNLYLPTEQQLIDQITKVEIQANNKNLE